MLLIPPMALIAPQVFARIAFESFFDPLGFGLFQTSNTQPKKNDDDKDEDNSKDFE